MVTLILLRHGDYEQGTGSVSAYHYDEDNRPAADIVELFGTHVLPTPFSNINKAREVISSNNPQAVVKIDRNINH